MFKIKRGISKRLQHQIQLSQTPEVRQYLAYLVEDHVTSQKIGPMENTHAAYYRLGQKELVEDLLITANTTVEEISKIQTITDEDYYE